MTIFSERPVLLVGNGWVDLPTLHQQARHAMIIALDGGANVLRQQGLRPEVIVGDLDSAQNSDQWRDEGVSVQHFSDQDSTDLDKVLRQLCAPSVVVLGVLGDRLDHALASLASVSRYGTGSRLLLIGRDDSVRYVSAQNCVLALPQQRRVSIWTMQSVAFVKSEGLAYPLDGLCLDPMGTIGTSNHTTAPRQRILKAQDQAGYFILARREDAQYL